MLVYFIVSMLSFIVWLLIYKNKFNKLKKFWKTNSEITLPNMFIDLLISNVILFFSSYIIWFISKLLSPNITSGNKVIPTNLIIINKAIELAGIIIILIIFYFSLKALIIRHKAIPDLKLAKKLAEKIIVWYILTWMLLYFIIYSFVLKILL